MIIIILTTTITLTITITITVIVIIIIHNKQLAIVAHFPTKLDILCKNWIL